MNLTSTESREIRRFGLTALIFFGSLHTLGLYMRKPVAAFLFGFLSILGLGFILLPSRLKLIYWGWQRIARLLGMIVTVSIMVLAYYVVITPSAMIKRLFGGIPLPVTPNKQAESYWVDRTEAVQPRERFLKRY